MMYKRLHKRKLCPKRMGITLLFILFCFLAPQFAHATVKLPKLVDNHMVLQRNIAIPIWGTAAVGESVTVTFKGSTYTVVTPASGKWAISLTPSAAGGPYTMTIAGTNTITLTDILIGDVYIAAGQSNMDKTFAYTTTSTLYAAEIANSANTNIRQFKLTFSLSATPKDDVSAAPRKWEEAAPAVMDYFSVVSYFFARNLYAKYGVPIGIINSSYGGTTIEAWISHEGLLNFPDLYNATPTSLADTNPSVVYNAMLSPLLNYGFKGFLWYQGESNSSNAFEYRSLFPAFIADVRAKFNNPNLPFLYVQLANWSGVTNPQQVSQIAEVREAQALANTINLTAMAVAHETGLSGSDIHPIWKKPIGDRLALAAQNLIYGETSVAYQGPSYLSHVVAGNKIVVTFKNVGTGLNQKGDAVLNQFNIAGADKVYKAATATITGLNTVEVMAASVSAPLYVRYAWADNPRNANLYNSANLPAESFRSDQATAASLYTAVPFTSGNLIVTRYGNGTALPATGTTVPIFLEEFDSDGQIQATSRAMPGIAGNYGAGITNLLVGTHSFGVESLLSLSENKKYLTFAANNAEVGLAVNAVGSKTIAILTADGGLNTTTSANWGVARTAIVNDDLSRIYYNSQTQGISYVPYGTASSNVVLAAGENAYRGLGIYNGQLYASTTVVAANGSIPAVSKQVSTVGVGMPTSGTQTLTALPGLPTIEIVRQFVFLSTAGDTVYDLFYGVTESGKLIKYKLVSGTWTDRGSVNIANVVSLTGKLTGGTAQLFSTTLNTSTYASTLVKVEDPTAVSSSLNANAVMVIATAATNTYFKGVAFAPENSDVTTLPIKLNSFKGAMETQGIKLKWETASEQNGDYFEVLRAEDGRIFKSIGRVKAIGNTAAQQKYTFTDFNPLAGFNYYQLSQVDLDGTSEKSKIIAIDAKIDLGIFKVAQISQSNFEATISSSSTANTKLIMTNLFGQKVLEQDYQLTNGINTLSFSKAGLPTGMYVLQLMVDQKRKAIKFYINNNF